MEPRILVFLLVILPVVSVCLGFTVHYAIRPMVEALVDALYEIARISDSRPSGDRLARLEAEISALREEVRDLRSADPTSVTGLPREVADRPRLTDSA